MVKNKTYIKACPTYHENCHFYDDNTSRTKMGNIKSTLIEKISKHRRLCDVLVPALFCNGAKDASRQILDKYVMNILNKLGARPYLDKRIYQQHAKEAERNITKYVYYRPIDGLQQRMVLACTLNYVKQNYSVEKFYYPGCGFDTVPREVFGVDKVTHVSLQAEHYFKEKSTDIRVAADFNTSPFKDNFFDATLIWCQPPYKIIPAIPELCRVTKYDGLIITGSQAITPCRTNADNIAKALDEKLHKIKTPIKHINIYRNRPISH